MNGRFVPVRMVHPISFGALFSVLLLASAAEREIPPAFGPHIHLQRADFAESKSFASTDRIVGTYYFYWYNVDTQEHLIDEDKSDALQDHPSTLKDFSYLSVRWHKQQLSDMIDAGIDVALPVFWGAPSERDPKAALHWSYAGLKPLVEAREELLREGKTPPRIGVFYDTSTLQYNAWNYHSDLTTDYGKSWFYATVRDFFSAIPPKHWAMINGKPIILMYAAAFAKKWDQGFIEYTKAEFKKEFSREPYIAPQDSWRVKGDNICAWGGAFGLKNPGIGELGPGYDDTAVYGRKPLIQKREGGKFYEQQWLKFLRRPSNFVMIETWNELHEGTEICETKEYGRQYIELTRKYSDLFKRGWQPPAPVGRFSSAQSVSVVLGPINQENGLRQIEHEDGQTTSTKIAGSNARTLKTSSPPSQYIYFVVDESFKSADAMNVTLEIEYHDAGQSTLTVEFDGSDPSTPFNGAYSRSVETVTLSDSKSWKTAPFQLNGARFANSQNSGADFRLATSAKELAVRKVTLKRH